MGGGDGAAALTPQELEVVQLAAGGLTNREIATRLFVSPRTVSTHLYRAFPKLGVSTRAALRDALGGGSDDALLSVVRLGVADTWQSSDGRCRRRP